jgi:hypothetical protein
MKRFLLVSLLYALATLPGLAQTVNLINFASMSHDYGTRKEEEGELNHTFVFTNVSNTPIQLLDVKASCGCTTPAWTKETVMPGQTGTIVATYNTRNRPGKFTKTITVQAVKVDPIKKIVTDSATKDVKILTISGDVIARQKGPQDWYPFEEGNLRYSTNHISLGNITNQDVKTKEVVIYNQGTKPVTLNNVETKPYINVEFVKNQKTVNPKDSIRINVTYDAKGVNDWDWQHERIYLYTNDDTLPKKTMYVSATIMPAFGKMTKADSLNAPTITFDKTTHDFGKINDKDAVSTTFVFKNTGKSTLEILKTKASCGCTATQPSKTKLEPGESSDIQVTFSPVGKKGEQMKQVTVITNDPKQPSIRLNIKADIQVPEN